MREILALIGYGLLLNGGLFMTIFWGRITYRRIKHLHGKKLMRDTYMVIAMALTIQSIGTGILFGSRAVSSLIDGVSTVARDNFISYLILFGLFTIVVAKTAFVWAIHLDRRSGIWRTYIAVSVIWTTIALYWVLVDPFQSFGNTSAIFSGK